MWKAICPLLIVFLAAAPAAAAKTDVVVKDTLKLTVLKAAAELPRAVDDAVKAGATEKEVDKSLRKMKEDKADPEAAVEVAKHFKRQADERTKDHGLSDVVHACLAQGKKGTDLVACVHEDWERKPKVKKEDKGEPDEAGKPEDKGKVEGKDKPEDKGMVEGKDKPEDKGKPKGKGGH